MTGESRLVALSDCSIGFHETIGSDAELTAMHDTLHAQYLQVHANVRSEPLVAALKASREILRAEERSTNK